MKIGFKEICINPEFPVNRMLGAKAEKIMDVSDDLHCRILVIDPMKQGQRLWYHISIDAVEIWKQIRDRIRNAVEEALVEKIDLVVSATHSHNCPCMTTDENWNAWLIEKISSEVKSIETKEYQKVEYCYQYRYFNQIGDSREANGKHPVVHLYAETLSFYGDGKRIGTILFHNCHPTIKELMKDPFTSEYPGYCIRRLKQMHPDEFFTFMLGPSGDVSPHFVRENRDYEEIARLGEKLVKEYEYQLQRQHDLKEVDKFIYREKMIEIEKGDANSMGNVFIPEYKRLTEQEIETIEKLIHPRKRLERKLEEMEKVDQHIVCQLILSDEYSIIFEPFELYSEYYGSVNKQTTSLVTISNGFDHYLTGLYLNHVTMHSITNGFGPKMKRDLWELFGKWSCQKDCDTF